MSSPRRGRGRAGRRRGGEHHSYSRRVALMCVVASRVEICRGMVPRRRLGRDVVVVVDVVCGRINREEEEREMTVVKKEKNKKGDDDARGERLCDEAKKKKTKKAQTFLTL